MLNTETITSLIQHNLPGYNNVLSFAEDTMIYLSNRNITNLVKETDAEINLLFDWLRAQKLVPEHRYMYIKIFSIWSK